MKKYYMGIDVGSVSTNVVLMDQKDPTLIVEKLYIRTNGQPIEAVKQGMQTLLQKGYQTDQIMGVGATGSARILIGNILGADVIKNEITAHAIAAITLYPDVRTILEIGGQDSKLIQIEDQVISDFAMNSVCAAGTGSFLDQQSFRLNIKIEDFGEYALRADQAVRIAGRCTVFAESDMIHKQQLGFSKEEIIAGLCEALVRNYLNNLAKGRDLKEPILFQGGVAFNKGIIAAFEKALGKKLIIPEHFNVMGAVGSAILAMENTDTEGTRFRGLDISGKGIRLRVRSCEDCSNFCELTEALLDEEPISIWGDRCGKWQIENQESA